MGWGKTHLGTKRAIVNNQNANKMNSIYFQILLNASIVAIAALIAFGLEYINPKNNQFASLILAAIVGIIFILEFWFLGLDSNWLASIIPFIFLLIAMSFIAKGGKQLAPKTITGKWSKFSGEVIAQLHPGSGVKNWESPFQFASANPDGDLNSTANLQEIAIIIPISKGYRTKDPGRMGFIESFYVKLHIIRDRAAEAFEIEGGEKTIIDITKEIPIEETLEHYIQLQTPEDFDARKHHHKTELETELTDAIRDFLIEQGWPYEIPAGKSVSIGSTKLDDVYYSKMEEKSNNLIQQDILNANAKQLAKRIKDFTASGFSEETFLVGSGIVKKNVEEKNVKTEVGLTEETTTGIASGIVKVINALK